MHLLVRLSFLFHVSKYLLKDFKVHFAFFSFNWDNPLCFRTPNGLRRSSSSYGGIRSCWKRLDFTSFSGSSEQLRLSLCSKASVVIIATTVRCKINFILYIFLNHGNVSFLRDAQVEKLDSDCSRLQQELQDSRDQNELLEFRILELEVSSGN